MHGIRQPEGLLESQKLPAPLFTPSTKAEQGAHDENISPERGKTIASPPYRVASLISVSQPPHSSGKSYTTKSLLLPSNSILLLQSTRPHVGSLLQIQSLSLGLSMGSSPSSTKLLPPIHRVTGLWRGTLRGAASRALTSNIYATGSRRRVSERASKMAQTGWAGQ